MTRASMQNIFRMPSGVMPTRPLSLNTFYQIVTLLDISVDQFFYPDRQNSESDCRQHIDIMLNSMDEKELTVMEATAEGLQKARETEVK